MRKWRLALIASTLSLILLMSVSLILHFAAIANNVNAATETYTITVRKNEAVSVYVTGIGVTYDEDSSSTASDIYHCEINTEYTLTAVNEKMMFHTWEITGASETITPTDSKYSATATEDIVVDTVRVAPTAEDYGRYMGNRFVISGVNELLALQEIIAWGEDFAITTKGFEVKKDSTITEYSLLDCYEMFLKDTKVKLNATDTEKVAFDKLSDENKVAFIKNNDIYDRMRKGYYLVETSFSLFDMGFTGIGSYNVDGTETGSTGERYFDGVMCGENNGENSQLVMVISDQKNANKRYYGLFGYLGENAVVRNLKVRTSIGISESDDPTIHSEGIYAGGIAGYAEDALIMNVDVAAEIGINATQVYEACAGAIVGYADGFNIDDISNISNSSHICKITVNTTGCNTTSHKAGNGYVGYLAGFAENTYVKKLEVDNTDMTLDVRNHDSYNDNIGVGGLIGHYHNNKESRFENILFDGVSNFRIEATLQKGISSAGGLVGHLVSDAKLVIGDVSIKNGSDRESYIAANTFDGTSQTDCFAGGLFARIDGNTVVANVEFKDRTVENKIDDKILIEYKPIFSGNITIEAIQNGQSNDNAGDTVSGGLVGMGYFDINGTSDKRTELILTTEGKLTILSTQTILATHIGINQEGSSIRNAKTYLKHCMVGGVYGVLSEDGTNNGKTLENIDVYAENINLSVNREIGSMTMGNMYVGGFISYADRFNIANINLKFNYGSIESNSLSYKVTSTVADSNNAHCGGFIGKFTDTTATNNSTPHTMTNCNVEGFDLLNPASVVGTNIKINSIQNSKAPGGGQNYIAENYVAGIVGQILNCNVSNLVYHGSENDIDIIRMAGHENPDSSFCGGIIGLIKNNSDWPGNGIQVENCRIYNATILGEGTNMANVQNPDMYVGGIVGSSYKENRSDATNITNCSVENSIIEGIGNENLEVYVAGVIGGVTWQGTLNVSRCHVYDTNIGAKANENKTTYDHARAYAAGIVGSTISATVNVNNNAVIDCSITADCNNSNRSYAAGIMGSIYNGNNLMGTTTYNYSNAILDAYHIGPLSIKTTNNGELSSDEFQNSFYYNQNGSLTNENQGSARGTAVSFADNQVNSNNDTLSLPDRFRNSDYLQLELVYGNNNFTVDSNGIQIDYQTTTENKTDVVEVWINTLGTNKTIADPVDSEEGRNSGWFLMGYINIYNNETGSPTTDNMTDVTVHFERGSEEFKKRDDGKFENVKYPYNDVDNIGYEYTYTTSSSNTRHDITAKVYDDIAALKINFKSSNLKYIEEFAYLH